MALTLLVWNAGRPVLIYFSGLRWPLHQAFLAHPQWGCRCCGTPAGCPQAGGLILHRYVPNSRLTETQPHLPSWYQLQSVRVRVRSLPPHTTKNSPTPSGCPTIQVNSDTIYLETMSNPTGEGLSSISDTNHQSRCHRCFWQMVTDHGFQQPPSWVPLIC